MAPVDDVLAYLLAEGERPPEPVQARPAAHTAAGSRIGGAESANAVGRGSRAIHARRAPSRGPSRR